MGRAADWAFQHHDLVLGSRRRQQWWQVWLSMLSLPLDGQGGQQAQEGLLMSCATSCC